MRPDDGAVDYLQRVGLAAAVRHRLQQHVQIGDRVVCWVAAEADQPFWLGIGTSIRDNNATRSAIMLTEDQVQNVEGAAAVSFKVDDHFFGRRGVTDHGKGFLMIGVPSDWFIGLMKAMVSGEKLNMDDYRRSYHRDLDGFAEAHSLF